jgi:hypothetical protein
LAASSEDFVGGIEAAAAIKSVINAAALLLSRSPLLFFVKETVDDDLPPLAMLPA